MKKEKISFTQVGQDKHIKKPNGSTQKADKNKKQNPSLFDCVEITGPGSVDNMDARLAAVEAYRVQHGNDAFKQKVRAEGYGWLPPHFVLGPVETAYEVWNGRIWLRVCEGEHTIMTFDETDPPKPVREPRTPPVRRNNG